MHKCYWQYNNLNTNVGKVIGFLFVFIRLNSGLITNTFRFHIISIPVKVAFPGDSLKFKMGLPEIFRVI